MNFTTNFSTRNLKAFVLLILVGLSFSVSAAEIPGFEKPVALDAKGLMPQKFIRDLFSQIGVPAIVDPGIPGEVHGKFEGTAGEVFSDISSTFNVHLYFNRSVAYVYRANQIKERLVRLSNKQSNEVIKMVNRLDLTNATNVINQIPGGGLEVLGHEKFVKKVEDILVTFKLTSSDGPKRNSERKKLKEPPLVVKEFKLKHASAEDYSEMRGNTDKKMPGVATLLRQFFTAEKSPEKVISSIESDSGSFTDGKLKSHTDLVRKPSRASRFEPSIVADPVRNSVWVEDSADRMPVYARMIESMDVEPLQVEVEVTIIDINANRQRELGVNWRAISEEGEVSVGEGNGLGQLFRPNQEARPLDNGGLLTLLIGDKTKFISRMRALEEKGVLSIVSKPHITTKSNQEGSVGLSTEFHVRLEGREEVALEKPRYGTVLRVRPRIIAESKKVNLAISIEDGAVSDGQVDRLPAIERSEVETNTIVFDGSSLLLGGLVRESFQNGHSKVPILGDIPGLGRLFRSDAKSDSKTERMFLITPRIIDINKDGHLLTGPVLHGRRDDIIINSDKRLEQGRDQIELKAQRFQKGIDGESPLKKPIDAFKNSVLAADKPSDIELEKTVLSSLLFIPPPPTGSPGNSAQVTANVVSASSGQSRWKVKDTLDVVNWQAVKR